MFLRDKLPSPEPSRVLTEEESRRARLVHLLRTREAWPPGFMWDYQACHTCAIGLLCTAGMIGNISARELSGMIGRRETAGLASFLGLTPDQAHRIFWRAGGGETAAGNWAVTPSRVADLIEHLAPIPALEAAARS